MDNQNPNAQDSNLPPVSPVVQTPPSTAPVSNPINPPVLKSRSKLPILIIGIILFLLIAGTAAGFYVYKQQSLKTAVKPTPSPVVQEQAPTPTPDPTANWKPYTNTKYNFQLMYPSEFIVVENRSNYSIEIYKKGSDVGFEWDRFIIDPEEALPKSISNETRFINAVSSLSFPPNNSKDNMQSIYVIQKSQNGRRFYFSCLYQDQDVKICNQILSTFKFTDSKITPTPDPTANWKTYNNIFGGISFKYPSEYIVGQEKIENRNIIAENKIVEIHTIEFKSQQGESMFLTIEENGNFTNNDGYQKFVRDGFQDKSKLKEIMMDGLTAVLDTSPIDMGVSFLHSSAGIYKNGKIYSFTLDSPKALGSKEAVLQQILSTFRFTN